MSPEGIKRQKKTSADATVKFGRKGCAARINKKKHNHTHGRPKTKKKAKEINKGRNKTKKNPKKAQKPFFPTTQYGRNLGKDAEEYSRGGRFR